MASKIWRLLLQALLICLVAAASGQAEEAAGGEAPAVPTAAATDKKKCILDREGSWSIGAMRGSNPLMMQPVPGDEPAISCASVSDAPASFVADPFWIKQAGAWARAAPRCGSFRHHCTPEALASCAIDDTRRLRARERASPTPRPPRGLRLRRRLHLRLRSGNESIWHAFYEVKNTRRKLGEIGAAVSHDGGASWTHTGAPRLPRRAPRALSPPHLLAACLPPLPKT